MIYQKKKSDIKCLKSYMIICKPSDMTHASINSEVKKLVYN